MNQGGNKSRWVFIIRWIVVAKFNEFITDKLLEGAIQGLTENGVNLDSITVVRYQGLLRYQYLQKKWHLAVNMSGDLPRGGYKGRHRPL
ncbi:MAG: hypothetical protein CM1200mP3_17180 [Chloroflexota bacterium]|nr:MAG: hypothetical protein CM1200mP3_17180 [Chloroflexota bacterium]